MSRFLTVATMALVLAACSTREQTSPPPAIALQRGDAIVENLEGRVRETTVLLRTHTLGASPSEVLSALQATYQKLGITVATLDASQGLIGNTNFRVVGKLADRPMSDFIICPVISSTPSLENTWFINLSVVTAVTAEGGQSRIQTAVQASAKNPHASANPFRCETRNTLEQLIASETALRLGVSLGR